MTYVLREELASKRRGYPIYFEQWTAIGPCCTSDLEKAARFVSEQDAMHSPAFTHWLSFFKPEPLEAGQ